MDIYLVRHGEAAAAWGQSTDPGLSELGVRQAQEAADALAAVLPAQVQLVSSPLARARETAAPLANRLSLSVAVDEAFREVPAPVPLPRRREWLGEFMRQAWSEQPRVLWDWRERALQQVLGLPASAVIFTHFLVINAIVGQVLQRAETLCFRPDNGSITHLRKIGGVLELVALGREMNTVVN